MHTRKLNRLTPHINHTNSWVSMECVCVMMSITPQAALTSTDDRDDDELKL